MKPFEIQRHGFTLIELSIALVIIGLLIGGVLGGQSLIRASELRAVVSEAQRYTAATQSFRDKFLSFPGDFGKATQVWGFQGTTAAPGCVSNAGITAVSATGACDGDDDNQLANGNQGNASEIYQFWRHMALAGFIEGNYTGVYGAAGSSSSNAQNSPKSKITLGYWQVGYATTALSGHASIFDRGPVGGVLQIGALYNSDGAGNRNPVLRPDEAWNIDVKIDDGKPATGNFTVRTNESTQALSACTTAASTADTSAQYQTSSTTVACAGLFYRVF